MKNQNPTRDGQTQPERCLFFRLWELCFLPLTLSPPVFPAPYSSTPVLTDRGPCLLSLQPSLHQQAPSAGLSRIHVLGGDLCSRDSEGPCSQALPCSITEAGRTGRWVRSRKMILSFQLNGHLEFAGGQWLRLPLPAQGLRVQSRVRDHMPCGWNTKA